MSSISSAPLCRCRCGQRTNPHPCNRRREGWIKGVTYYEYLRGHHKPGRRPDPARAANVAEAQRLVWDEGLDRHEVAERLGVTKETVDHWMSDPSGERSRARGARHRARRQREDPEGFRAYNRARNRRRRGRRKPESWLRASELVAWIGERVDIAQLSDSSRRALLRWQQSPNNRARIDGVDRLLTEVGIHLSELPEELWT